MVASARLGRLDAKRPGVWCDYGGDDFSGFGAGKNFKSAFLDIEKFSNAYGLDVFELGSFLLYVAEGCCGDMSYTCYICRRVISPNAVT